MKTGTEIGSGSVTPYDCANGYYICRYADVVGVPEGKEIMAEPEISTYQKSALDTAYINR